MNDLSRGGALRATIGIVAGSGPEAGLDLWAKLLARNAAAFGPSFRGDLDAPRVVVLSEPTLGLSMDLAKNAEVVWESLRQTAARMAVQSDAWVIACNTLNWYDPRIAALNLPGEFISFQSVLTDWIARTGIRRLGLLGAAPVTEMGEWSAYQGLREVVEVETPADPAELHQLIFDVKRLGSQNATLRPRFARIAESMTADTLLLACTELPLIADIAVPKSLIDVTDLVDDALVARSLGEDRSGLATPTP
jgi:aspartate racemase